MTFSRQKVVFLICVFLPKHLIFSNRAILYLVTERVLFNRVDGRHPMGYGEELLIVVYNKNSFFFVFFKRTRIAFLRINYYIKLYTPSEFKYMMFKIVHTY